MALYALLAGITNYKDKTLPVLYGPAKDAVRIKDYLEKYFDPNELHLLQLINETATKQAIVKGFTEHLAKASTNDQVLFYFSGHGALEQIHEAFKKKPNDLSMETLVCYDSLAGETTLADKELRYLVNDLAQQCPSLTILLDCCHSGGATRNADLILKKISRKVETRQWNQFIFSDKIGEANIRAAKSISDILPEGEHIQLTACASGESAWEVRGAAIFTSCLLQVLEQTKTNISYNDIYSRVKRMVNSRFDQTPDLYIKANDRIRYADRLFLGGINTNQNAANANIVFINAYNNWILDKGAIQGVRMISDGFDLDVYRMEGGPVVSRAGIREILPDSSVLEMENENLSKASYFTKINGLYQQPLTLFLQGEQIGINVLNEYFRVNEKIYKSQGIRLTTIYAEADYIVLADKDSYVFIKPGDPFNRDHLEPLLSQVNGYQSESAEIVFSYANSISKWEFAKELTNPSTAITGFPASLVLESTSDGNIIDALSKETIEVSYDVTASSKPEKEFILSLTNRSEKAMYFGLACLGIDFSVAIDFMEDRVFMAGPGSTEYAAGKVCFTQEDHTTRFNKPKELYYFLLIASTVKFEIDNLEQGGLPLPGSSIRGITTGDTRSTGQKGTLPLADWCTRLTRLELNNPYYKI